jgi:hypothetical protein
METVVVYKQKVLGGTGRAKSATDSGEASDESFHRFG